MLFKNPIFTPPYRLFLLNPVYLIITNWVCIHLLVVILIMPNALLAQEECSTPDPDQATYEALRLKAYDYRTAVESRGSQDAEIPVYYTVIRNANGMVTGIPNGISASNIDAALSYLNSRFEGGGVHFYRLGEINYIDHDIFNELNTGGIPVHNYSYVRTALNVYVRPGSNGTNQPGSNLSGAPEEYNITSLAPLTIASQLHWIYYAHETGHNFGLLHTFGPVGKDNGQSILFDYPTVLDPILGPDVYDHPYEGQRPRELAIRSNTPGKNFPTKNCFDAADFCCDTKADCNNAYSRTFPAFNPTNIATCLQGLAGCVNGCVKSPDCSSAGDYRDYNGDPIPGEFDNLMGYLPTCSTLPNGLHFTNEQKAIISGTYNDFWDGWFDDSPINVTDRVEFRGSTTPMQNVTIRWRHNSDPAHYTNSISNGAGGFQGVLYDPNVKAEARKIGSTKSIAGFFYPPGQPTQAYYTDTYTYGDWLQDVNCWDLFRINRHILGIEPFNDGYLMISSDANNSNTITTTDLVELRKLILGKYKKLPGFDTPWRFIPEYIPQDYPLQFHYNPFQMIINGQSVTGTPYTQPTWEYQITNGANDKSGYDGLKIGDVIDNNTPCSQEPPSFAFDTPVLLVPDETYDITIKSTGFNSIVAYQLGMFVDHGKLEVLDIIGAGLPDFSKEDNFGLDDLSNDQLNHVWYKTDASGHTQSDGSPLFTLVVKTLEPVTDINAALNLDPEKAAIGTMFYNQQGCVDSVELEASIAVSDRSNFGNYSNPDFLVNSQSALYCYPNPMKDRLILAFEHEVASSATLFFTNQYGQLIKAMPVEVSIGINALTIDAHELLALPSGVLNISLQTGEGIKTGRLIKL